MPTPTSPTAIHSRTRLALLAAFAGLAPIAHAQSTMEWASPVDGDFSEAGNWLPAVVPAWEDTAVLGGSAAYTVNVGGWWQPGHIELANPEATILVRNGATLNFDTGVTGPGVIEVSDGVTTEDYAVLWPFNATVDTLVRLNGVGPFQARVHGRAVLGANGVITGQGTIQDDVWGGTVRGSAGDTLDMRSTELWQSRLDGREGTFVTDSNTLLRDTTVLGTYRIDPGNAMTLREGVVIEEEIIVGDGVMLGGAASLLVRGGVTVDGFIRLNGSAGIQATFRDSVGSTGGDIFLSENTVVSGQGTIIGHVFSQGLIEAREDGLLYLIGQLTGGELRSNAGSRVALGQCRLIDGVLIDATAGGAFFTERDTIVRDSTIRGELGVLARHDLTLGPSVTIEGAIVVSDGITTAGEAGLFVQDGAVLDGPVRLDGAAIDDAFIHPDAGTLTIGPAARITGHGRIFGPAVSAGTLAPGAGGEAEGVGQLEHRISLDLDPAARLELDIAGPGMDEYDRLTGPGALTLGGTLTVDFVGGYFPGPGDHFQIIDGATIQGTFDAVDVADPSGIGPAHLLYGATAVTLIPCAADRDADGELTIFDFLEFQNQFDAGDPRADLDQDGALTIFDFLAFQNRFDAGCG